MDKNNLILKNILIFITALILTLLTVRIFYLFVPFAVGSIGSYNFKHLFIGSFLLVFSVIFLILEIRNKLVISLAGISSALILDELVFLIFTDASFKSYRGKLSLWGAIILTLLILIFIKILFKIRTSKSQ